MSSPGADLPYKTQNEAAADRDNDTTLSSASAAVDQEEQTSGGGFGFSSETLHSPAIETGTNESRDGDCYQGIVCRDATDGSAGGVATTAGLESTDEPAPGSRTAPTGNSSLHLVRDRPLLKTSPPPVKSELSRDRDTSDMARNKYTSIPEDAVPLKLEDLKISQACPPRGGDVSNGAVTSNGASPARQHNGTCLGSEKKLSKTASHSGDTKNRAEKQKLVSAEIPEKPGQKRVSIDSEETRLLDCKPVRDVSNLRTYMNLFKTLTGPSTVGMPRVIRNGGLLTGFVGFLFIGVLNAYCNITMVRCSRILGDRSGKTWYLYEEVVEGSFASYSDSPNWQKAAKYGRRVALFMLILCQLGLMSFYYQIIATTLQKELEEVFGPSAVPLVLVELCVCLCVLPYSWLRNLRLQAWFSTLANILNVVCIGIILQYACRHMKPVSEVDLTPQDPWTIPLFIGGAVFTVEGIAMILPIENRTRHPKDYTGPFGMVALATATNVIVNLTVGFYGYLAFGNEASGNILVSLPGMWVYRLVSIMYAAMVFLTFNLQLYQPAEAIYSWLRKSVESDFVLMHGNLATRTALVILTFLFAALVPRVDLMMSLIGAFCAGFLVFVLPIVSELLLLHGGPGGVSWTTWVKDVLILLFGVTAFLTGTYTSVRDIVVALKHKH